MVLYNSGGPVSLSALVANASACTFGSNRGLSGMPTTVPCSNGVVSVTVVIPPNTHKRALKYRFHLAVTGQRGNVRAVPVFVTVSTAPLPPPFPTNSQWALNQNSISPGCISETVESTSTFNYVDNIVQSQMGTGTYTIEPNGGIAESWQEHLVLPEVVYNLRFTFTGTWDAATQRFVGTFTVESLTQGSATLAPGNC